MEPILQIEHLSITFTQYSRGARRRELPVIRDLSLSLSPGEVTAVVGASGSGKSLLAHAILHEASVTFLGFGLSSEQPAIGVILSESMRYLTTGKWWLALFPGAALVLVVVLFALLGERVRLLADPASAHE